MSTTGNVENAEVLIGDIDGVPAVLNWDGYGPRRTPPLDADAQPLTVCVSISTVPDHTHCWTPEQ